MLAGRDAARWPATRLGIVDGYVPDNLQDFLRRDVLLLTLVVPFTVLFLSFVLWGPVVETVVWGWIILAAAGLFLALAAWLRQQPVRDRLAAMHDVVGLSMLTLALPLLLDDWVLLLAYTGETIVLHLLARRWTRLLFSAAAHGVAGLTFLLALLHLVGALTVGTDMATHLSLLAVMGTLAALSTWVRRTRARNRYLLAAFSLLALWLPVVLEGPGLLVAYTVQAATLHLLGWRLERKMLVGSGHLAMALIGVWVASRLMGQAAGLAALADLLFVASVALISILLIPAARRTYLILAHAGLLLWFWSTLEALENGQALISVAWGIYGVILLLVGLRIDQSRVRLTAMGTLGLLVGKLFLFNLANVATILRILLFFGFGILFLVLGYFYPSLWRPRVEGGSSG